MQTPMLSVGIDVGKTKLDVACMRQDRSSAHQAFSNSPKGIKELKRFLKQQGTANAVPCTMESTGSYHYLIALSLSEAGYRVNCVNPIITKKYRKATIRDAKSDKTDSMRIAELGANEPNLQQFSLSREDIAAKSVLSALWFLERTLQQLEGHIAHFEELEKTVGVKIDQRAARKAAEWMQRQIKVHRESLAVQSSQAAREIAAHIPGVSLNHVAALLVGLEDRQFENRDQLIAFVGLDIKTRQSGSWVGRQVLSKRGNGYLRKILFQIAWGLKTHNADYAAYYRQLRDPSIIRDPTARIPSSRPHANSATTSRKLHVAGRQSRERLSCPSPVAWYDWHIWASYISISTPSSPISKSAASAATSRSAPTPRSRLPIWRVPSRTSLCHHLHSTPTRRLRDSSKAVSPAHRLTP